MSETIYDLVKALDISTAKEFITKRESVDGKDVTLFQLADAKDKDKWYPASDIETLSIRNREYQHLNLADHGLTKKSYRWFKKDYTDKHAELCNAIRGKLGAVELTLDMMDLRIKMSRKTANQKVKMDDALIETVLNKMSETFMKGADTMRHVKRDKAELVIY